MLSVAGKSQEPRGDVSMLALNQTFVDRHLGSDRQLTFRLARASKVWPKSKNPLSAAARREREEDWG
jgi:hypothetical protein